jgi:hypothetical protein
MITLPLPPLAKVLHEQLDCLLAHHARCSTERSFAARCPECDRLAGVVAALTLPFAEIRYDVGIARRPRAA